MKVEETRASAKADAAATSPQFITNAASDQTPSRGAAPSSPDAFNPRRTIIGLGLWTCAAIALIVLGTQPRETPSTEVAGGASIEPIKVPDLPHHPAQADTATRRMIARAGDTLSTLLRRAGLAREEAEAVVVAVSQHFDPRRLKVGQGVKLTFASLGESAPGETARDRLVNLSIEADVDRKVEANRRFDGAFDVKELVAPLDRQPVRVSGTIEDSLFMSATKAGLPAKVVLDLIKIFSYDVDFQREIQRDDAFEVVFDRHFDADGNAVRDGDIVFAALTLSGRRLELYRHTPSDTGEADYFDAAGRSVKRALLRTPIDGARLTSGFGMRNHPVLGYTRMHRGVDFAAPTGTPIQAAGGGVIEEAGRHAGYGIYVRLRHDDTYETAYGHMSRLAEGMKPGRRVRQGQIIGYVGATGLATGPHLHYEVLVDEDQVNPASVKLPSGRQLQGPMMAEFKGTLTRLADMRANLPNNARLASARPVAP